MSRKYVGAKPYVGTFQLSEQVDRLFNTLQAEGMARGEYIYRMPYYNEARRVATLMYPNTKKSVAFNMALMDMLNVELQNYNSQAA